MTSDRAEDGSIAPSCAWLSCWALSTQATSSGEGKVPAYASGWIRASATQSIVPAGSSSTKPRPIGCSEQAIAVCPSVAAPISGPVTTARALAAAASSPPGVATQPAVQHAPTQARLIQLAGWSRSTGKATASPGPTSSSSSRFAVLATQLAYEIAESSVRCPPPG